MGVTRKEFDGWSPDRPLTVQIAGNIVDITQTERPPARLNIEWLDADSYIDLSTGELKKANHSESRGDKMSLPELRRTFKRMRALINSNWFGDNNELLITLTYKENMQDPKRLARDLDKFNKSMKRQLGNIKYLAAVEPQERGAWHAHILVKQLTSHYTYWPHEAVSKIWPHGEIIDVQRLKTVDNVGAYLSAYLSNTPVEANYPREILREAGTNKPKAVVKGGRLHMYPRGMHLYRASTNLDKPIVKKIRPISEEYESLIERGRITFTSKLALSGTNTETQESYFINNISQMQINLNSKSGV